MAKRVVDEASLSSVAEAIRAYTGTTEVIEFPTGFEKGVSRAYAEGWVNGYRVGIPSIMHEQYDKFWDTYQDDGERRNYREAFENWSAYDFHPKHNIVVENGYEIFRAFNNAGINGKAYYPSYDMEQGLGGVSLDFSKATNVNQAFFAACMNSVGEIDLSNAIEADYVFYASEIPTIKKLVFPSKASVACMFDYAALLENIVIEGTITQSVNLQWSTKLTHDSLMSFINALEDRSTGTNGAARYLIIGSTNLAKLTDTELAMARDKGWKVQ